MDETKQTPPAQVLGVSGIESQEKVYDVSPGLLPIVDEQAKKFFAEEKPVNKKLLLELTLLEHNLRRRATSNLKRRANLLNRVNRLRKALDMEQKRLTDFL